MLTAKKSEQKSWQEPNRRNRCPVNDESNRDNDAYNERNYLMHSIGETPEQARGQKEHNQRWQPKRNTTMSPKQIAE